MGRRYLSTTVSLMTWRTSAIRKDETTNPKPNHHPNVHWVLYSLALPPGYKQTDCRWQELRIHCRGPCPGRSRGSVASASAEESLFGGPHPDVRARVHGQRDRLPPRAHQV